MAEEVLASLLDVFNSASYQPLTLRQATERVKSRGLYLDLPFAQAAAQVHNLLCSEHDDIKARFHSFEFNGQLFWGLESWLPPTESWTSVMANTEFEPMPLGTELEYEITNEAIESGEWLFQLKGSRWAQLLRAMDAEPSRSGMVLTRCLGDVEFWSRFDLDVRAIGGELLRRWYRGNGVQPKDCIHLRVEGIQPLVVRIYTDWEQDQEAFRRYVERRHIVGVPKTELCLRDLIWLFLSETQKTVRISSIAAALTRNRPEITSAAISNCLAQNPHLFVQLTRRGDWGLAEWGLNQITCNPLVPARPFSVLAESPGPKQTASLDTVLTYIRSEDLVYKILASSRSSLSDSQIIARLANFLGVEVVTLGRISFLNPGDARLLRLQDGSWCVREDLNQVIKQLTLEKETLLSQMDCLQEDHVREVDERKDEVAMIIATAEGSRQFQSAKMAELDQSLGAAQGQIQRLMARLTATKQEIEKGSGRIRELERIQGELTRNMAKAQQENGSLAFELAKAKNEMGQARDESSRVSGQLASTRKTLEQSMTLITSSLDKVRAQQMERSQLERAKEQAQLEIVRLSAERDKLLKQFESQSMEVEKSKTALSQLIFALDLYFDRPTTSVIADVLRGQRPNGPKPTEAKS